MRIWLILLLLPFMAHTAEDPLAAITDKYCEGLKTLDWKTEGDNHVVDEFYRLGIELSLDNTGELAGLMDYVRASAPELSGEEVEKECNHLIITELITHCPAFLDLARQTLPDAPQANRSLQMIAGDLEEVISLNTHLSYADQLLLADAEIVSIILKRQNQLNKDYTDGYMDYQLPYDLAGYLFHHNDDYLKAYLGTVLKDMLE